MPTGLCFSLFCFYFFTVLALSASRVMPTGHAFRFLCSVPSPMVKLYCITLRSAGAGAGAIFRAGVISQAASSLLCFALIDIRLR